MVVFKTYEEHIKAKKTLITPVRKMYEQYNYVLEKLLKKLNEWS